MTTERASKPSCRLSGVSTYVERKLGKLKDGFQKKVVNLRNSFGHYEHPGESCNGVGNFPVPTSPNNFYTNCAPGSFPEPALPQGCRPQKFDFYEASGSNHTSNPNSAYFDASSEEYRLQHVIPNYEDFRPAISDQLASLLQNDLLLDTPTSHYQRQPEFDPGTEYMINDPWSDARDQHQTDNNTTLSTTFQNGWMMPDAKHQIENNTSTSTTFQTCGSMMDEYGRTENNTTSTTFPTYASMMDQHDETENNATSTTFPTYGSMMDEYENNTTSTMFQTHGSMMTGDTGESRESMIDTGASNCNKYILDPVAEEARTSFVRHKLFYEFYVDLRRIVRRESEGARGSSSRRGRGFRIMGRILCIAIRLKGRRILRRMRKRPHCAPGQNRAQCWRQPQCRKRIRTGGLAGSGIQSDQSRSAKHKGVTYRNGRWNAEIRVSQTKEKVWLGTFETKVHAALAADAGMHHCSVKKKKKFNFPDLVKFLGPSQYTDVHALYLANRKEDARAKVTEWARIHADTCARWC